MRNIIEKPFTNQSDGSVLTYYLTFCDSSETKPEANVCDGSIAIESDSGKVFLFNEKTGTWAEMFSLTW